MSEQPKRTRARKTRNADPAQAEALTAPVPQRGTRTDLLPRVALPTPKAIASLRNGHWPE